MSQKPPNPKQLRANELHDMITAIQDEIADDPELQAYFRDLGRCQKCGSIEYEELLDEDAGKVYACSDCPEDTEHH